MSSPVPYDRRFVAGQSGSGGRFLPQQSSPVPSPYAPQSPATGYRQYPHPPAYSQHQHLQQGLHKHTHTYSSSSMHRDFSQFSDLFRHHSVFSPGSVASPMIPGGMRNVQENKVEGLGLSWLWNLADD